MRGGKFHQGFTLIELVLVMGMLLTVLAVAAPSLAGFFRGRNLDSEARRFLSMTRYGQSRAVSEGIPMVMWIDAAQGVYGLQSAPGYDAYDIKAVEHGVAPTVTMEVGNASLATVLGQGNAGTQTAAGMLPMIRFEPDGFIHETSPMEVTLKENESFAIWIVQSRNLLHYEIQSSPMELSVR